MDKALPGRLIIERWSIPAMRRFRDVARYVPSLIEPAPFGVAGFFWEKLGDRAPAVETAGCQASLAIAGR